MAVTAGSRGIANIHLITKAIVDHLKTLGAKPFIVPAMGSHGGGTAEGQREILEGYGITEEFVGCPIRASMERSIVCQTAEGFPVHLDRNASEADHVGVVARVKPHTGFIGAIESGLMKMMMIGLGKHVGAEDLSPRPPGLQLRPDRPLRRPAVLAKCRIVGRPGDRRERLRRNGPDRSRAAGRVRRPREGAAGPGQAAGCRGCRSTRPTC